MPTVRQYYTVGGELVSMPTGVSTDIMCGNKAMLERAGIERMPATWQELEAACASIIGLPDGPSHGASWPNYGWLFQMELAGQGGLLSNNGNGRTGRSTRVFLDSPEMLNYVRWWKRMHESGYYLATEELHYATAMQAFLNQEIAFTVSLSAILQLTSDMAAEAGWGSRWASCRARTRCRPLAASSAAARSSWPPACPRRGRTAPLPTSSISSTRRTR